MEYQNQGELDVDSKPVELKEEKRSEVGFEEEDEIETGLYLEKVKLRRGRQNTKRTNMLAKQVISIQSAVSLGFVSQLWVDMGSWVVLVVEVKPNFFMVKQKGFFLKMLVRLVMLYLCLQQMKKKRKKTFIWLQAVLTMLLQVQLLLMLLTKFLFQVVHRVMLLLGNLLNKRIVVPIDSWDRQSRYPFGHYVRVMGDIGDRDTESEMVLIENDIDARPFTA
ncbi:hypothetical protein Q3G72_000906 [Acer saccharum]|nr:hypothetical protein Q3G72_000906 [Acer saccharum]